MSLNQKNKFKNAFMAWDNHPWYLGALIDTGSSCRLKGNHIFLALLSSKNNIGVLPSVPNGQPGQSIKIEAKNYPINLLSSKPIADFTWSPHVPTMLAAGSKSDGLIQCWNVEYKEYRECVKTKEAANKDAADYYLAGHEQKIKKLLFHPSLNNALASTSQDGTLRLWDVLTMREKSAITCSDQTFQSFSWSPDCELISAVTDSGILEIRDFRAPEQCKLATDAALVWSQPSRGIRVLWPQFLQSQPTIYQGLLITSAINKASDREICIWDQRSLKGPVKSFPQNNSLGQAPLELVADEALPLLYGLNAGESLRLFELNSNGDIESVGKLDAPKASLLATAVLGKRDLVVNKCEVSRFTHITSDRTVLSSVLRVPRVNGQQQFQDDLYPLVGTTNESVSLDQWLNAKSASVSAKPNLVALNVFHDIASPTYPYENFAELEIAKHTGPGNSETPSMPISRQSSVSREVKNPAAPKKAPFGNTSIDENEENQEFKYETWRRREIILVKLVQSSMVQYDLSDDKGFLSAQLELRNTHLIVHLIPPTEQPLATLNLQTVDTINYYDVRGSKVIELVDSLSHVTCILKFAHVALASKWEALLSSSVKKLPEPELINAIGIDNLQPKNTSLVREKTLKKPQSNTVLRTTSILHRHRQEALLASRLSLIEYKTTAQRRWVLLGKNGILTIHEDSLNNLPPNTPPLEKIDLAQIIAVGLVDLSQAEIRFKHTKSSTSIAFFILLASRKLIFGVKNFQEAADWISEIGKLINSENLLPAAENLKNSFAEACATLQNKELLWICCVNGLLFYFNSNVSQVPIAILKDSQVSVQDSDNALDKWTISIKAREVPKFLQADFLQHLFVDKDTCGKWALAWDQMLKEGSDLIESIKLDNSKEVNEVLNLATETDTKVFNTENCKDFVVLNGSENAILCFFGKTQISCHSFKPTSALLCSDGVYLLDLGRLILQYNAPASSRVARAYALGIGSLIKKTRSPKPEYRQVSDAEVDARLFLDSVLKSESACDESHDSPKDALQCINELACNKVSRDHFNCDSKLILYKLQPNSLTPRTQGVICYSGPAPSRTLLHEDTVYLLVNESFQELFLWIGKSASTVAKAFGKLVLKKAAEHLVEKSNISARQLLGQVRVSINTQDHEDPVFKSNFVDYEGMLPISMKTVETKGNIAAATVQKEIDVKELQSTCKALNEDEQLELPIEGALSVFAVSDFQLAALHKDLRTPLNIPLCLQASKSYLCLFQYSVDAATKSVAYFWQGANSTQLQMGTAAMLTIEVADSLNGNCKHVRVVQGKEPAHFRRLLSIHGLICPSGCSGGSLRVFDIRVSGSWTKSTCLIACEISPKDTSFYPASVVVYSKDNFAAAHVWQGSLWNTCINETEAFIVKAFPRCSLSWIEDLSKDIPGNFIWYKQRAIVSAGDCKAAELYHVSSISGAVQIKPVCRPWQKEDLDDKTVSVLVSEPTVFIWFGSHSRLNEKVFSMRFFKEFAKKNCSALTNVVVVQSNAEPVLFWQHFHGWSSSCVEYFMKPVDEILFQYTERNQLSLEQIFAYQKEPVSAPVWVNLSQLEVYLSDIDFEKLLKMSRTEFDKLGQWKRDDLKRKLGIF